MVAAGSGTSVVFQGWGSSGGSKAVEVHPARAKDAITTVAAPIARHRMVPRIGGASPPASRWLEPFGQEFGEVAPVHVREVVRLRAATDPVREVHGALRRGGEGGQQRVLRDLH